MGVAPTIFAHIVLFESSVTVSKTVSSLLSQRDADILVSVTDNGSRNGTFDELKRNFGGERRVEFVRNAQNMGFCGAHNHGIKRFLDHGSDFYCAVNPDLFFAQNALGVLAAYLRDIPQAGMACPKLLRADLRLEPLSPAVIDAAGMFITPACRHLDRGSGQVDRGQFDEPGFVFGGSGAALMMKREAVLDLLLDGGTGEQDLFDIYPQLSESKETRAQLFDEAFFAYREDADLAWRAQIQGWSCVYVPAAVGYHERKVLPERRKILPSELNSLGVRNRFLLQFNNYSFLDSARSFIEGAILRNLVVICAVLLFERSSFPALREALKLRGRALARRRILMGRRRERVGKWFDSAPRFFGIR